MKKTILYPILITIFLVIIAVIGSTYAYYSLVTYGNNRTVSANSEKYEVVYTGGTHINGETCEMNIVASKEEGCHTDVNIGISNGVNVTVNANLFINVESISNELKTAGFKWEVYRVAGQTETLVSSGNFASIPNNNQITILTNEPLSTSLKTFRIYFWIDGNLTDNSVAGKSFDGYIGANTEVLTGIVNNN